ncbi:MAG TPA: radical SAM family heme chaperone HemW [Acidiferrobacter sp.]|nr:radical SAM family heme chaperone HemW [Acidiferrobacter sp.]
MSAPLPPLSLYIHIPWCVAKCPYCDFHSVARQGALPEVAYAQALLADFDRAKAAIAGRAIASIFFGGGTPSLFSGAAIHEILSGINRRATLAPDCEITLEANPGTVETGRFAAFREAGVTRLSLGLQSLHDPALRRLGRIHDASAARAALEQVVTSGFRSFNIDLMYGLPGQTAAQALADVHEVLAAKPLHLSLYELTIEAHTAFAHAPPVLPSEAEREAIEDAVQAAAQAGGLQRYEISAYARPGYRCAHNLNYWEFGDYLGLGAGAHSKLHYQDGVVREVRVPSVDRYLKSGADQIMTRRSLAEADLVFEFLLNALRLIEGFSPQLFRERTGCEFPTQAPQCAQAVADGLLTVEAERVRATALGHRFLDSLLASLLAESPSRHPFSESYHALG